jgi:hypothetical protein
MEHVLTPPNVYQFRVVVQGISPLIWRRLLSRSDMSLARPGQPKIWVTAYFDQEIVEWFRLSHFK